MGGFNSVGVFIYLVLIWLLILSFVLVWIKYKIRRDRHRYLLYSIRDKLVKYVIEDKINLIKDSFEHNGLKQYMEYLDSNIVISTVHAAKGLEWDYVIIPDMEQDLFPNWHGLCGSCKYRGDCNIIISSDNKKNFLEELSVFYVAVTRAKKQVFFSASKSQITLYGERQKNISCFMKLPGMIINKSTTPQHSV